MYICGVGSYRKIDAIAVLGAINAVFIYVNLEEIKVVYRFIKEGRFVEGKKSCKFIEI